MFGYRPMIYSTAGIAGLGFIVWGHHMFQSGMDPRLGTGFMLATILIALHHQQPAGKGANLDEFLKLLPRRSAR